MLELKELLFCSAITELDGVNHYANPKNPFEEELQKRYKHGLKLLTYLIDDANLTQEFIDFREKLKNEK